MTSRHAARKVRTPRCASIGSEEKYGEWSQAESSGRGSENEDAAIGGEATKHVRRPWHCRKRPSAGHSNFTRVSCPALQATKARIPLGHRKLDRRQVRPQWFLDVLKNRRVAGVQSRYPSVQLHRRLRDSLKHQRPPFAQAGEIRTRPMQPPPPLLRLWRQVARTRSELK